MNLEQIISEYGRNPILARRQLAHWAETDPKDLRNHVAPLLMRIQESPGWLYLVSLLLDHNLLLSLICDQRNLPTPQAAAVVERMIRLIPLIDVKLLRSLLDRGEKGLSQEEAEQAEFLVTVLNKASPGNRMLPTLVQLLRRSDSRARSKTAIALGARNIQSEVLLTDPDPRVRANAVESFWGIDSLRARRMFRLAMSDANNRVVGNSLLGLLKLGDRTVIKHVLAMSDHASSLHRATAAWVMGQAGLPDFIAALEALCSDQDEKVRRNASQSLALIKPSAAPVQEIVALRVNIGQASLMADGRRRIWAEISTNRGTDLEGLRNKNIALFEDGTLVSEFRFLPRRRSTLAVGFAIPSASGSLASVARLAERGLRQFFEYRRESDYWALTRYLAVDHTLSGQEASADHEPRRGLTIPKKQNTTPAERLKVRFSKLPMSGQFGLTNSFATASAHAHLIDAMLNLLDGLSGVFADSNLVVVAGDHSFPPDDPKVSAQLGEILARADSAGVLIHVVLLPGTSGLVEETMLRFAAASGGLFLRAETVEDIPRLVEIAYMCLSNGHEFLYGPLPHPRENASCAITLRVETENAKGEDTSRLLLRTAALTLRGGLILSPE